MDVRLNDKVALITGGSRGLGLAMAKTFAKAGADLAIAARRPDLLESAKAEIDAAGAGRVMAVSCDVTDSAQCVALVEGIVGELGRIDILVNNAGQSAAGAIVDSTDELWRADFELKLFSAVRLSRLVFPGMQSRKWGRIINVLNSHAKAPPPNSSPTSVSRAAGMSLTKVLAGEGAPHNILVNALCTGQIMSDQWHGFHQKRAPEKTFEEFTASVGARIPLGRMGEAQEFANMACFLASDQGSYVTGTAINVDGGLNPVV